MPAPGATDGLQASAAAPDHAHHGFCLSSSRDKGPCSICNNPTAHSCMTCAARLWLAAAPKERSTPARAEPPHKLCQICEFDQALRCCSECNFLFANIPTLTGNMRPGPCRGPAAPLQRSWQLLLDLERPPDPADVEEDAALPDRKGLIRDDRATPSSTSLPLGMPAISVPDFHGVTFRGLPPPGTWVNLAMSYETSTLGCPPVCAFVFWNIQKARWERFAALTRSDEVPLPSRFPAASAVGRPAGPPAGEPSSVPPIAIRMGAQAYSAWAEATTNAAASVPHRTSAPPFAKNYGHARGMPNLWARPASSLAPAGGSIPPAPPWPPPSDGRRHCP